MRSALHRVHLGPGGGGQVSPTDYAVTTGFPASSFELSARGNHRKKLPGQAVVRDPTVQPPMELPEIAGGNLAAAIPKAYILNSRGRSSIG